MKRIDLSAPAAEDSSNLVCPSGVLFEEAAFNDCRAIAGLLTENNLPVPDADDKPVRFIVARQRERIVACLGWESYGFAVFLRSLAVSQEFRRQGLGSALVRAALSRLAAGGVSEFYLLTSGAADFAAQFGFKPIDRSLLPAAVHTSRQFATYCCSGAQCMQLHLSVGLS